MKTIKIFLASSEELKRERLLFVEAIQDERARLRKQDVDISLEKWEYFDASLGVQHKQQDYNDILRECDLCVVMYWTKFGGYTKEEFDVAYSIQKEHPEKQTLFVYFKDTNECSPELQAFKDSFTETYGFEYTIFDKFDVLWKDLLPHIK